MTMLNHTHEEKQRLGLHKAIICKTTFALFSDSLDLDEGDIREMIFALMNYKNCVTSEHSENDSIETFISQCNHIGLSLPKVKNYYDDFIVGITDNEAEESDLTESQKMRDYEKLVNG